MSEKYAEMRKSGRYSSEAVLKYRPDSVKSGEDYFFGITQDVSKSGACLFLLNEVNVGERINILHNPLTPDKSAVVKWVKKIQDGIYKAGMMFE